MTENQERMDECKEVLTNLVQLLALGAEVDSVDEEEGDIVARLKAGNAGRLIGRKGQHLESLELIVNRILQKRDPKGAYVILDIDGYRRQRPPRRRRGGAGAEGNADAGAGAEGGAGAPSFDEELDPKMRQLAVDVAKEVKRWGESRELGPFSARDRRAIHTTLRDDPELITESGPDEGNGFKKVIVSLKGKDQAQS